MRSFKFSKNCLCTKIMNLQKPKIFGIFVNHFLKHVNIFAQNTISFQKLNQSKCIGTMLNSLMTHVSSIFLSTNFFEAIFAVGFEVSQDLFQKKLKRLWNHVWNDLSVKEFVLLHSRHNFCSTFFLLKMLKDDDIIWWLSNTHQCRVVLTQALKFFWAFRLLQKLVYKFADCFCTMNLAN